MTLVASCWCEQSFVVVDRARLRWGPGTLSCGRRGCESPEGDRERGPRVDERGYHRPHGQRVRLASATRR